ncbi:TOBE domain-containing protein [Geobacter sp. 60473]|nr:TOBE domain-containing protein [Geobacter sulfurreducens]
MKGSRHDMEVAGTLWLHKADRKFLGSDRIALLEKIREYGSITKAAKAVGLSYKTAWDMVNHLNNMADRPLVERTAGGKGGGGTRLTREGTELIEQFSIIQEEHRRFLDTISERLVNSDSLYAFLRRIAMKVSARNVFLGTVSGITKGAVNAEVSLTLKGGTPIAAVVTNASIDSLGLAVGKEAYAIVKASSIIIGTDLHDAKVSARNIMCGTIVKVIEGPVSTEVDVEIGAGNTISAVITHESAVRLDLKEGGHACALFKASSVILGVS